MNKKSRWPPWIFIPVFVTISLLSFLVYVFYVQKHTLATYQVGINNQNNYQNVTIEIPLDRCYCERTNWHDILTFFALNYGAHALTVRVLPGESLTMTTMRAVFAIIYPFGGIALELRIIQNIPLYKLPWKEHSIKRAKRAQALCAVTRGYRTSIFDILNNRSTTVFGQVGELPDGYIFRTIASFDKVVPTTWNDNIHDSQTVSEPTTEPADTGLLEVFHQPRELKIPPSSTYLKALVSIGQACYGIFSLIRASAICGEIRKYGFASPTFTVFPYVTMSLINAASVLITPSFPVQYAVSSKDLNDAMAEGWRFDQRALVGHLVENDQQAQGSTTAAQSQSSKPRSHRTHRIACKLVMLAVVIFIGVISTAGHYILVAIFTRFEGGESSPTQQRLILGWMMIGTTVTLSAISLTIRGWVDNYTFKKYKKLGITYELPRFGDFLSRKHPNISTNTRYWLNSCVISLFYAIGITATVMCFVVVWQLLQGTGQCVQLE